MNITDDQLNTETHIDTVTEAYIERMLQIQNDPNIAENEMMTFALIKEKREWFYKWIKPSENKLIFLDAFYFYASFDGANRSLYKIEYRLNCGEILITEHHPDFKILETVFKQLIERNKPCTS